MYTALDHMILSYTRFSEGGGIWETLTLSVESNKASSSQFASEALPGVRTHWAGQADGAGNKYTTYDTRYP